MPKYTGTAVIQKDYEVLADNEDDARLDIIDIADAEYPNADLYLVRDIQEVY